MIAPNCKIVEVEGLTEGAACTTLLAKEYINNDNPLIMANSDQFVEWSSSKFMYKMQEQDLDGGILSFKSTHPKWSYAKTDENKLLLGRLDWAGARITVSGRDGAASAGVSDRVCRSADHPAHADHLGRPRTNNRWDKLR